MRALIVLLSGLIIAALPAHLAAQSRGPELTFALNIRAIGASGAKNRSENRQSQQVTVDDRLRDLREKLARLPFASYRLIGQQDSKAQMRKRDRIRLVNGQSLVVRPLEFDQDAITMWLKWEDCDGMNILDTRIHFNYGESMLAGIEGQEDTGVILAIDVRPSTE